MTTAPAAPGVSVLLLDIEGTTTPITFVTDVLFPYARRHLRAFAHAHASMPEVRDAIARLREERAGESDHSAPAWSDEGAAATTGSAADYAEWLMARDAKSPGLKALQGLVWKVGYETGELHGDVFDDVPRAFRAARDRGVRVAIYSSGSVLAQQLLFGSTRYGDLRPQISAYFDTGVGMKRDPASYRAIAKALDCAPAAMLFLSDIAQELTAAREAGCDVALAIRPGNAPQQISADIRTVSQIEI